MGEGAPLVRKVPAIQEHPDPSAKKQGRQFLGQVGYYRRFIPGFASLAAPRWNSSHRTGRSVSTAPECAEAFQTLKDDLCREPVLYSPDFSSSFEFQMDASAMGLGAVLSQTLDREEHLVLYISQNLFPRECNRSTIEKEALAGKWSMEATRYYLLSGPFIVVTDHAPLK